MNKLESMLKTICKDAGIEGNFTNQSGKSTCATHLYQAGVDEQSIMMRTGHRSVQGVRKYKRPSDTQLKEISNILEPPKCLKSEDNLVNINSALKKECTIEKDTSEPKSDEKWIENRFGTLRSVAAISNGKFYNCVFHF